jgi:hypothetical protein
MESLDQIWRDYHEGLLGFIRRRVGAADRRILQKSPSQVRLFEAHRAWKTSEHYDR